VRPGYEPVEVCATPWVDEAKFAVEDCRVRRQFGEGRSHTWQPAFEIEANVAAVGRGNARLPLPPLLMLDRIAHIDGTSGIFGNGQIVAELSVARNVRLDWVLSCHFKGDPVMPGCLLLDALWQILGFFLGWSGVAGRNHALGVGEVKFKGMVTPDVECLQYSVEVKSAAPAGSNVAIANGLIRADGRLVYTAEDLRVGLVEAHHEAAPTTSAL
jgi:3-hydroxyacyl-[acyl-carrier protein] dehydratase / trans-2-decenoyl-[acyl-carrier protein] isomerase